MITDPFADLLTRLRNATAVDKDMTTAPHSKLKEALLQVLQKHKFIESVHVEGESVKKTLVIQLIPEKKLHIKRISKPGQRIYVQAGDIKKTKNGYGISVISTSQGLMIGKDAYMKKIGGEFLCEIY